jgi:hypothetical protein
VNCVEAIVGEAGVINGVKLQDQVLVTKDAFENIIRLSCENAFLK